MNENFVKTSKTNWSNYTFLFPCVSVGNIGQLATDLLISTIVDIKKAGYLINNRLVQPIVGYDPYGSSELCVSVEIYESEVLNLVIMQQRAPLFKGRRNDFVLLLKNFIKQENFKEMICLTSSHAYERLDSQLVGHQCRFLSTSILKDDLNELVNTFNWLYLEKRNDHGSFKGNNVDNFKEVKQQDLSCYIPGGGIAQKFYKACEEEKLNCKILIIFAHEGNNIPESFVLVNYLNQWKQYLQRINCTNWKVPVSWAYLFGQSMDRNTESQLF